MQTILFDWDGTLVDSIQALFETDAAICRKVGVPFDEPQIERLGLHQLLTVRVYGHDTQAGKPDPAPLQLALDLCGAVRPQDAIYVGDALDDMRMAASAGVRGVGIESMLATAEELLAAGAVESARATLEWADRFLAGHRGPG
jgi:phosphoglycolate phosphatase